MEQNLIPPTTFLLNEKVGYLKSKFEVLNGKLYLTEDRLVLISNKTTLGGGLLGSILKRQVEKKKYGFDMPLAQISAVERGKHGVNKNVLEINDKNRDQYRILVKDYVFWENAIKEKLKS